MFINDPVKRLDDKRQKLLIIPVSNLQINYSDNTKPVQEVLFSDSFFIDAANSLTKYYCSKKFDVCTTGENLPVFKEADSFFKRSGFSTIIEGTEDSATIARKIRYVASEFKVDLVLIPFSCIIKHAAFQPKGWSEAPNYQRPVKYKSKTEAHFQIWDSSGKLLYERLGQSDTGRPIFYSLLKRESSEKDVAEQILQLYAPPIVRSLERAIETSLTIGK
jgi:hypothetical protein